jgi:hypothetical protein
MPKRKPKLTNVAHLQIGDPFWHREKFYVRGVADGVLVSARPKGDKDIAEVKFRYGTLVLCRGLT